MKTSINALHHQERDWQRELEFYNDELKILNERLEEIAGKYSTSDVLAQVEHFQNRFILLNQEHSLLRKAGAERSGKIDKMAQLRPEHIEEKFVEYNDVVHVRMLDFVSSFQNTRLEFNKFLSKVM